LKVASQIIRYQRWRPVLAKKYMCHTLQFANGGKYKDDDRKLGYKNYKTLT